jgi:hypothetical protein
VVLIQIITIYAFLVLEGIVYSITEDFDRINELLSDAIYIIYFFLASVMSLNYRTPFQLLTWYLAMGKSCHYHQKITCFV